ncbi:hypothetical protein QR680_002296 [Steinernema hermaphroditum]|uniref:Carboxylic ester hydrolase n=1 Tax=Steinernema hermaphroditum TaxID=289476 RepID=A0AA39H4A8_9BILA|nr:hypothetical protein QR680_002296 [Steinernema hermaphroditum]
MGNVNSYLWPEVGEPGIVVKTSLGTIRGKTITIDDGRRVHAFLGIPYAEAPVGELRFQKPIPIEPWDDVKNCTKFGSRAIQADMIWDRFIVPVAKSEDCLHLNVFVPEWETETQRPVLVFIHGGGFAIHSTANYGDKGICRNICRHDVIVVTIQYRLGLLGFLSTGDENCPGNIGLWDQTLALKWVKENIDSFGGNPDNITVFGQSAGAVGADLLSISPHSRDLFKRVILMGGNAECDWAIVKPESGLKIAESIALKNGWKCDDEVDTVKRNRSLIDFLRLLPTQQLEIGLWGCSGFNRKEKGLKFCPVIDNDFLPHPVHVLREQAPRKECMVGTAEYEALLFVALGKPQCNLISIDKMLAATIPPNDHDVITRARQLYLSSKDPTCKVSVARSFVALFSDLMMNNGTQAYCREMTKAGHDLYLYSFDYHNPNAFGFLSYRMPFKAATHCYDLRFLFGKGFFSKFSPDSDDLRMIDIMTSYWTAFAKNGNPNGNDPSQQWQKLCIEDTYRYLSISLQPQFKSNYHDRRAEFWRNVLPS